MLSEEQIILNLKQGDEEAFAFLYEKYADSLLRHLFNLLGNIEMAEDMLHEVMMLMISKINFYSARPELKNSFKSWLYRLATNRAIDEMRKNKKGVNLELKLEIDTNERTDELYEKKEQEQLISDLLLKLPLIQRMVLSMRVLDDLSYLEISIVCGRDINSVKQGLFQARKSMKTLMMQEGEWL